MSIYYSVTNKSFYDSELLYSSLPDDIVEVTADQHKQLLYAINNLNKEIYLDSNEELQLRNKTIIITWADIRYRRNKLLNDTDFTQMPDSPGDKSAWATYRQQLRDLPQIYSKPENVEFPTPPGA